LPLPAQEKSATRQKEDTSMRDESEKLDMAIKSLKLEIAEDGGQYEVDEKSPKASK